MNYIEILVYGVLEPPYTYVYVRTLYNVQYRSQSVSPSMETLMKIPSGIYV